MCAAASLQVDNSNWSLPISILFGCFAFICVLYRSPNDNSCAEMFEQLSSQVEHIDQRYPSAEVIISGHFNVHNSHG